jgi:hypothetical protein
MLAVLRLASDKLEHALRILGFTHEGITGFSKYYGRRNPSLGLPAIAF